MRPAFKVQRPDRRRRPAAKEHDGDRSDLDPELADEGAVDGDILVLPVDPVVEMHLHLASGHFQHHIILPVQRVAGNLPARGAGDIGGASLIADDAATVCSGLADHPGAVGALAVIIEEILDKGQRVAVDRAGHIHPELAAQIAEPVLEDAVGDAVAGEEISKVERRLPVGENRHIAAGTGRQPGQKAKRHRRGDKKSGDPAHRPGRSGLFGIGHGLSPSGGWHMFGKKARGVSPDQVDLFRRHPVERPVHHSHPRIAAKPVTVADQEIPVEIVERARLLAVLPRHLVAAAGAIVGHAVDIGPARGIGLAGQIAAIGEQHHARYIRQLDPFIGVGIDHKIPFIHVARVDAGQKREIPQHHQTLDMVRIGIAARRIDRLPHAVHVGLAAPEEIRKLAVRAKEIHSGVIRHLQPVDAAHKLAPAEDLADKPLDSVQRRMAGVPGRLGGANSLRRQQQAGIQIEADMAVIHPGLALDHRILIGAEQRQSFGDEPIQNLKRLIAGHGKTEIIQITEMVRAALGDKRQNLGGDGVGGKFRGLWDRQGQIGGFAVFRVIVPFAADRLAALHQHIMMTAHLAIEEFHAKLLAALGPAFEHAGRAHEPVVVPDLDIDSQLVFPAAHRRKDTVLAGFGQHKPFCAVPCHRARHLTGKAAAVGLVIKPDVIDGDAFLAKFVGKVAHRREQEGDLALVMADIGDFLDHLGHQHDIPFLVETGQPGQRA